MMHIAVKILYFSYLLMYLLHFTLLHTTSLVTLTVSVPFVIQIDGHEVIEEVFEELAYFFTT